MWYGTLVYDLSPPTLLIGFKYNTSQSKPTMQTKDFRLRALNFGFVYLVLHIHQIVLWRGSFLLGAHREHQPAKGSTTQVLICLFRVSRFFLLSSPSNRNVLLDKKSRLIRLNLFQTWQKKLWFMAPKQNGDSLAKSNIMRSESRRKFQSLDKILRNKLLPASPIISAGIALQMIMGDNLKILLKERF